MQVGALRDIKRDMALRRNSLHKQLVHELEDRVFVSVGIPKGTSGNPDDPEGDEDDSRSLSDSLIRSRARLFQAIFCSPLLHVLKAVVWKWTTSNVAHHLSIMLLCTS